MKALSAVNKYFIKYKWRLLLGVVFIVATNYFKIISPQITGYIINRVLDSIKGVQTNEDVKNLNYLVKLVLVQFQGFSFDKKIVWACGVLFISAIVSGFFMFLMRQTIIVMSRLIEFDQKNEVYQKYQSLDRFFYNNNTIGDLMNRISEDVGKVRMYTGPALMYFINLAAVIGFSVYFMWRADSKLTLVALLPLPILAIIIYFVNQVIDKKSVRIQSLLSDLTSNAQETYSGVRVIKSYVQEKNMFHFFNNSVLGYRNAALSLAKTEAIYFPSMALIIGISTLLTIMVGALDVVHNVPGATLGKIAEFVMYIQLLTFPVSAIGWTASMTQRAAASQKRINQFLDAKPMIQNAPNAVAPNILGNISFTGVSFTFPESGIQALKDIQFSIHKGEKVAIIGSTASGKTTLANLMLRFYDADLGTINFDEFPIKNINLQALRSQVGYVPQEVFLFSDTIANNIAFGKQNATRADIEKAAKMAQVYDEVMGLPMGFDTVVGERGVTLSGGQKQRISIARALLGNPSVLVLDDCLSAVDANTEQKIMASLHKFFQNKTAIIITHRVFSLMEFDKLIVLDEGRIVEAGTHQQLLQQNGKYAELYKTQMKNLHNQ